MLLARTERKDQVEKRTLGMTLFYTDFDRDHIEAQRIPKMGRAAVDSNATFIDDLFIPESDRIGEEGKGFYYLLHSLNPERILVGAEAVGLGQDAVARAAKYAREREVFGRPIGQNQGIQHPLAECWAQLEAAFWLTMRAASLYDQGEDCGAEANAAKLLGGQAGFKACTQAVLTHGGMGYSKEYQVERLLRESLIARIAPVSEQMVLSFIAEQVLDLPKSY
jgi:acyl-CoA dehydrogenase